MIATTFALGRALFADKREVAPLGMALAMTPAFFVYGGLLMFDQLLALFILMSLLMLWRRRTRRRSNHGLRSASPWALGFSPRGRCCCSMFCRRRFLVSYWKPHDAPAVSRKAGWWRAARRARQCRLIILSWAVPAAIIGGKEFARMIFWEQVRRAHGEELRSSPPVLVLHPVIAAFLFPLFFLGPLWRGMREHKGTALPPGVRFLLSWIVPTLTAFCFISGKQPHYLLPLIPGTGLVAAYFASRVAWVPKDRVWAAVPVAFLFLVLAAGPIIAAHITQDTPTGFCMTAWRISTRG